MAMSEIWALSREAQLELSPKPSCCSHFQGLGNVHSCLVDLRSKSVAKSSVPSVSPKSRRLGKRNSRAFELLHSPSPVLHLSKSSQIPRPGPAQGLCAAQSMKFSLLLDS